MPYTLHIPGERPRALRWTVHDARSSYGAGVLVYRNGREMVPSRGLEPRAICLQGSRST